jgi:hypothetical protein
MKYLNKLLIIIRTIGSSNMNKFHILMFISINLFDYSKINNNKLFLKNRPKLILKYSQENILHA